MLNYKGGGLKEATKKLKAQGYNKGKLAIRDFLRSKFKSQDRVMNKGKEGALPGAVFIQEKKNGFI